DYYCSVWDGGLTTWVF
nr:immunoglobulin light chain junction region [Macaca mulatta]